MGVGIGFSSQIQLMSSAITSINEGSFKEDKLNIICTIKRYAQKKADTKLYSQGTHTHKLVFGFL